GGVGTKLFQAERGRLQAEKKAIEEEARRILIEVALVYKALQMQEGLYADDLPVGSIEQVVAGLKRFKFPFAPLLLKVEIGSLGDASDFRFFHKIKSEAPKSLQKRFEALKSQATDILGKLSQAQPPTQEKDYAPLKEQIDVKIFKTPN
ncbi:MAG: hypothetical protein KKD99_05625, partial [Proteobacteria bacterium]|nr:hypothetical protein [Pseudomonadota bacterium]